MDTNLIYVSDIPSSIKPVLLLHELENKCSRMLYLENSFSGMRDAFIYNPTPSLPHFYKGIQKLRERVFEDSKHLKVLNVWFPPPNIFITTMIPDGASMLSYIFVENLHKEGNVTEFTADLPFQQHDIKLWDIPEREDKCLVIKLPPSCNSAIISYVLGTLRNRKVQGFYPKVYEIIVSENPELSKIMVPKTIKTNEPSESYLANFLFMHNIPAKLNVKSLVDSTKIDNIKGCRVFFLEAMNNCKLGFAYIPKTLPYSKFTGLLEKLRVTDYAVDDGTRCKINLDEVWFQPLDADPPQLSQKELLSESPPEFVLTQYLYLHNIPPNVVSAQLLVGCPRPIKLYVFSVQDMSTQFGFVVLRGLGADCCQIVLDHFRTMVLGGLPILVDEIYLKCYNLPAPAFREMEHIPRSMSDRTVESKKRTILINQIGGDLEPSQCTVDIPNSIRLSKPPPEHLALMKSEFLCLSNLPKGTNKTAIIFDIGVRVGGCVLTTSSEGKTFAFIYLPDLAECIWERLVSKFASKCVQDCFLNVHEVYLQTNERSVEKIVDTEYKPSPFLFVYNLPMTSTEEEKALYNHETIFDIAFMITSTGTRCAVATLYNYVQDHQIVKCLSYIKSVKINGKPLFVDLLWLADVTVDAGQPPEKKVRSQI